MIHVCEWWPVTYGSYANHTPEPRQCGAPAELRLRVTYFCDDHSVDHQEEVYSCLACFDEALELSGHNEPPLADDWADFNPSNHDPSCGPKYEILEALLHDINDE